MLIKAQGVYKASDFYKFYQRSGPRWENWLFVGMGVFLLVNWLWGMLYYGLSGWSDLSMWFTLMVSLALICNRLWLPGLKAVTVFRRAKLGEGERVIEFSDKGVAARKGSVEIKADWPDVHKVKVYEDQIDLFITKLAAQVVPRRFIRTEEEWSEVVRLVGEKKIES